MSDPAVSKRVFARELDALLKNSPKSTARITALARHHQIGYSTLRSWCTGVHLPRTPQDNPGLRAFLYTVAADQVDARRVLAFAEQAWRCATGPARRQPVTGTEQPVSTQAHTAYRRAGPEVRRLLSWLGASRCRDMAAEAVEAMTGWPAAATRRRLAELVDSGLVVRRGTGQYLVPDGVRLMVDGHRTDEGEVRDAEARLAVFYGRTTSAAARRLFPDLLEPAPLPAASPLRFTTEVAASNWLLTERDNLVAVAEAVHGRDPELDAALTDALSVAQQVRPHPAFWAPLADATLRNSDGHGDIRDGDDTEGGDGAAAQAAYAAGIAYWNHPLAAADLFASAARQWPGTRFQRERAAALHMLGVIEHALGHSSLSVRYCTESLRLRRRLGEHRAQASTLVFLADACLDLELPAAAEQHARTAITLAERTGYSAGIAGALGNLGNALLTQGVPDEAEYQFVQQQALSENLMFHSRTAFALVGRARVANHLQRFDSAVDLAEQAAAVALAVGNIPAEVDAYLAAAHAHVSRGRRAQAQALHDRARQLAERTGCRTGGGAAPIGLRQPRT